MMIPYGYKQTEVGVIPEDWECVKIKDVATISMCKRIFANQTSTIGDVPFYKIGTFGKEADACISSKLYLEYRNKYSFPQKGDILISAAGTLGRTVVYDGEKAYFQDSNIVWLDINKTRLCNEYLNQYYKVIKWASSEGSTIARLYNGIIYATYISLPPLPEQQRIAEALSDVDGMISSLEKLIAKYKSIKTACLQQMFPQNGETVPRIRLPGFTGAWEQRKLGEVIRLNGRIGFRGYTEKDIVSKDDGGVLTFSPTNIVDNKLTTNCKNTYITRFKYDESPEIMLQTGDILLSKDGTIGKIGYVDRLDYPSTVASGIFVIRNIKPDIISTPFIYYLLKSKLFTAFIASRTEGSVITHLYQKDFMEFMIPLPNAQEMNQFDSLTSPLFATIVKNLRENELLAATRDALLPKLMNGEIDVSAVQI